MAITDKSGAAGIMAWLQDRYEFADPVAKDDVRLKKINDWITQEYEDGRITAVSDEEMDEQVHQNFGDVPRRPERW